DDDAGERARVRAAAARAAIVDLERPAPRAHVPRGERPVVGAHRLGGFAELEEEDRAHAEGYRRRRGRATRRRACENRIMRRVWVLCLVAAAPAGARPVPTGATVEVRRDGPAGPILLHWVLPPIDEDVRITVLGASARDGDRVDIVDEKG